MAIYKYDIEDGLLKQGSLLHIPFETNLGFSVLVDDIPLVKGLDYRKDGSRLWIERDIKGKVITLSDNDSECKNILLDKIISLEQKLEELKNSQQDQKEEVDKLKQSDTNTYNTLIKHYDILMVDRYKLSKLEEDTKEKLNAFSQDIIKLADDIKDDLANFKEKLNRDVADIFNTLTSDYYALKKEMAAINDKLATKKDISFLKLKYEELKGGINFLEDKYNNLPDSIKQEELNDLIGKYSQLKQSLGMETAQRVRADKEIKLLLQGLLDDMARLEDIVISNFEDKDLITGILEDIRKDLEGRIDGLARVNTASMLREFKIKQWLKDNETVFDDSLDSLSRIITANMLRLSKVKQSITEQKENNGGAL